MKTRLRWSLGFAIVLAALVGWLVNGALAAGDDSKLTLRLQPTEHAFVTQSGTTSTFPGYLGPGARALSRDVIQQLAQLHCAQYFKVCHLISAPAL